MLAFMKFRDVTLVVIELICLSMFWTNQKLVMGEIFNFLVAVNPGGALSRQSFENLEDYQKSDFAPLMVIPGSGHPRGIIVARWQEGRFAQQHPDYSYTIPAQGVPVQTDEDGILKKPGWYCVSTNQAGHQEVESHRYSDDGTWTTSWYEILDRKTIKPLYFRPGLSPAKMICILLMSLVLTLSLHILISAGLNLVWHRRDAVLMLSEQERTDNLTSKGRLKQSIAAALIISIVLPLVVGLTLFSTLWSG